MNDGFICQPDDTMRLNLPSLLCAMILPLVPGRVSADELMGSQSQWSIVYVADRGEYCDIAWDSQLGRKVEFQAGRNTISWVVTNDAWRLAGSGGGQVKAVGHGGRVWKFTGKAQSTTSLLLSDNTEDAASIRTILGKAIAGGSDIDLKFPGTEPDWTVPVSRLFSMRSTVTQCMSRIKSNLIDKRGNETTSPF